MENVVVIDHPLVQHKLTLMRLSLIHILMQLDSAADVMIDNP